MRHLAAGFMGSLLLVAAACGGKVVVESTGATGSGGAGGTSVGDTGNGGFINSTGDVSPVGEVSAVTTGGMSLCQQVCGNQQAKGCDVSTCLNDCQQAYAQAGMCTSKLDAVTQCYLVNQDPSCNPKSCDGLVQSYQSCITQSTCGGNPMSCSVSNDGSCDCQTDCNGSTLEVQCTPGNATDFCLCIKDGKPVDKCPQPQGMGLSCDIVKGCCAKAFFP
ncbi:MAG: hypothetical protein ABJE95_34485 [Byssovorax sp.]